MEAKAVLTSPKKNDKPFMMYFLFNHLHLLHYVHHIQGTRL